MTVDLSYRVLRGREVEAVLEDVARLRVTVFREWPYLYDGDMAYERRYLADYAAEGAVIVVAQTGERVVGAATAMPILQHADQFGSAFVGSGIDLSEVFYCAESVLLSEYRGRGAGRVFFEHREDEARRQGFIYAAFCAVRREVINPRVEDVNPKSTVDNPQDAANFPQPPEGYTPLDRFWKRLGYRPLDGVLARFSWRDIGAEQETEKELQFWLKKL